MSMAELASAAPTSGGVSLQSSIIRFTVPVTSYNLPRSFTSGPTPFPLRGAEICLHGLWVVSLTLFTITTLRSC